VVFLAAVLHVDVGSDDIWEGDVEQWDEGAEHRGLPNTVAGLKSARCFSTISLKSVCAEPAEKFFDSRKTICKL